MVSPETALAREIVSSPEREVDPKSIGIATATFYKDWNPLSPGLARRDSKDVIGIRGDLALRMLSIVKAKGFQIVTVDGGSSDAFRSKVHELGVQLRNEKKRGMSAGRRQAFQEISQREGVKVIVWSEPEKLSIPQDCLPEAALPVLSGDADIVIPKRDEAAFATYPQYQAVYEQAANKAWNEILKKKGLLPESAPDLDVWIGPRIFKNSQEVMAPFLDVYEFDTRQQKYYAHVKPELWPNALFLPVVAALHRGLRVKSVPVNYRHPEQQTASEKDSPEFEGKRKEQFRNILVTTSHFIHYLEDKPKGPKRLHPAA